jgi:hypothetical protein
VQAPVTPAVTFPPVVAQPAPAVPPAAAQATAAPLLTALSHQALRASVEATGETGVFRVKLLAGNELAPLTGHEALLVLLDPKANLLRAQ